MFRQVIDRQVLPEMLLNITDRHLYLASGIGIGDAFRGYTLHHHLHDLLPDLLDRLDLIGKIVTLQQFQILNALRLKGHS